MLLNNIQSKTNDNLKISKDFYNKDASASVTKSLLTIHDDFQKGSEHYNELKLSESELSFSSASSVSISNKFQVEQSLKRDEKILPSDRFVTSASCILFLNNLVEKNLENLQTSHSTDELKTLSSFEADSLFLKHNLSLKTLKNASKSSAFLVKRFSLKNLKRSNSKLTNTSFDGVVNQKKIEGQKDIIQTCVKLVSKVLSGQPTLSNSNNNLKIDKLKRADLSNSTSSYSNLSSSNSSQANYSQINEQRLANKEKHPKQDNLETEKSLSTQQLDTTDSINTNMSFYMSHTKPNNNPSYNNNNLYNQNHLLSKKLRKHLPNSLGLRNHGNTCFMNCILQCLFHTSPLADFFITHQFEHDIEFIIHQKKDANLSNHIVNTNQNLPQFLFTNRFYRLLNSLWKNTYEANLSHELKQLIGHLNPTFSGGTQNDSHELCVWLLDKLSQELSFKLADKSLSSDSTLNPPKTSSFVEELFQVEFKSTVVCSKCNYHSSKYETDMMLSLPLPQNQTINTKHDEPKKIAKQQRKPIYPLLILANQASIKNIIANDNSGSVEQSSRSTFYVPSTNQTQNGHSQSSNHHTTPFHVKIGFCIQSGVDSNSTETINDYMITNPRISGLRTYISSAYHLNQANLVFINLNNIQKNLTDDHSVSNCFLTQSNRTAFNTNPSDSMCILELSSPLLNNNESQIPLLNIIGINVYHESSLHEPAEMKRLVSYGMPFVLLINRDCSYSELCRKLLESQSKFFKDKNMLKYKDLVEKLFTLSLSDSSDSRNRLRPSDELPLYAECVEKAINTSQMNMPQENNVEYIKLNIEWHSLDGISNLFKDIDYTRAEFIHKSVKNVQKIMELESINNLSSDVDSLAFSSPPSPHSSTAVSTATLDDCFKLFTEREHLTDENSWMCPKCQKQTNAYKNLSMSQVPPILIIHLKRFFYKSKTSNFKLTTPVWFPVNNLDISKFIDKKSAKMKGSSSSETNRNGNSDFDYDSSDCENGYDGRDESYMYDLFGVSNHKGTNMANGHYTAYCKNLVDTKWYCFDDANCTPLSDLNQTTSQHSSPGNILNNGSNFVCSENAYILFYKKRNCMQNERWWTSYVDKALYEHDEFDRFLYNLDQIELEQCTHQLSQQTKQLRQHLSTNRIQIVSRNTMNNNNQQQKKSIGLNKIKNMLTHNNHKKEYDEPIYNNNIEVNRYDENIKPNRLLKQNHHHHKLSPQNNQQQVSSNFLTMNTITDIPSSDSNSSLNNSNFIYSTRPQANKTNCFRTQVEPANDIYERRINERTNNDIQQFSGNILYDYPADNVYKFQLSPRMQQSSHHQQYQAENICEFQPNHIRSTTCQPLRVNSYLTPPKNSSPVSYQSSNKSLSPNSKSPGNSSHNRHSSSRYINPTTIETPI